MKRRAPIFRGCGGFAAFGLSSPHCNRGLFMARQAATATLEFGIALVACALLVAPVGAQNPQDPCAAKDGVLFDQRIAACSSVIESGNAAPRDRASAFVNRGNAY